MAVDERSLERAVAAVVDRELDLPLGEVGMVHSTAARRGRAEVTLALPTPSWPGKDDLRRRVAEAAAAVPGVHEAAVGVGVMADDGREALRVALRARMAGTGASGTSGTQETHDGHAHGGGHARPTPAFLQPGSKTRVVGISSGKGGVGKSSVT
ncbi:MAG: iron-sulfur cluster assembly protein, partial [Acidimicrobiales bacterium]